MIKYFLIFFIALSFYAVKAQPGSLDPTFGVAGKVSTSFGTLYDNGSAVVIQPDGKIIVAGSMRVGAYYDFAIARYHSNGNLDTSFDSDGRVTTDFSTFSDQAYSIALQTDGKIVVAGISSNGSNTDFAIARYNSSGSLDSSFDSDGKVTTPIGISNDHGRSLAIQTDGKIILAGHSMGTDYDIAAVRYNVDGSLDNMFDSDGKTTIDLGGFLDYGHGISLQLDGKIILTGSSDLNGTADVVLMRLFSNGSLDNTFDLDGISLTDISASGDHGNSCTIQPDGKILVGGITNADFLLVRYNSDGSLDLSLDTDGKVITDIFGGYEGAGSVKRLPNGKIVLAGERNNGTSFEFAIACYNTNGSLDTSFSSDGMDTTSIGPFGSNAYAMAVQSDGRIVVAGSTDFGTDSDIALVRYNGFPVGISEEKFSTTLTVFPNPVSSVLTLFSEKLFNKASVTITNTTGQTVFAKNNLNGNDLSFDVSFFANGIYFLEITDDRIILRAKFIKE